MREEFYLHEILWLGYLVYSLCNCAMKLCIETGLSSENFLDFDTVTLLFLFDKYYIIID